MVQSGLGCLARLYCTIFSIESTIKVCYQSLLSRSITKVYYRTPDKILDRFTTGGWRRCTRSGSSATTSAAEGVGLAGRGIHVLRATQGRPTSWMPRPLGNVSTPHGQLCGPTGPSSPPRRAVVRCARYCTPNAQKPVSHHSIHRRQPGRRSVPCAALAPIRASCRWTVHTFSALRQYLLDHAISLLLRTVFFMHHPLSAPHPTLVLDRNISLAASTQTQPSSKIYSSTEECTTCNPVCNCTSPCTCASSCACWCR